MKAGIELIQHGAGTTHHKEEQTMTDFDAIHAALNAAYAAIDAADADAALNDAYADAYAAYAAYADAITEGATDND